jgi:hypothetical protein
MTSSDRLYYVRQSANAYFQVAGTLREQSLDRQAENFERKARHLQRKIARRTNQSGDWFVNLASWILAGYGFSLRRCVFWYLLFVLGFTIIYYWVNEGLIADVVMRDLVSGNWGIDWESATLAFNESVAIFHGRGQALSGPPLFGALGFLPAIEAILGLVIEATFIATFVRRFLAR